MNSIVLTLLSFVFATTCNAQATSGLARYFCDAEESTLDDTLPYEGSVHALWIICSCSHAAVDSSIGQNCGDLIYPATHEMPDWAEWVLDPTDNTSLSKYFSDQSGGLHQLTGDVKGQNDTTVFISSVWPLNPRCVNDGGYDFYIDVMERVDAVVNFNDYNADGVTGDTVVDFLFFNIYGFCIDSNCLGTGEGVAGLAGCNDSALAMCFESNDTLANGHRIWVKDGVSFWSPAVEAFPSDADNAYWATHGVAAHEYGHKLGLNHWGAGQGSDSTAHAAFGAFDVMCSGSFGEPVLPGHAGPTSPFVPYARVERGWVEEETVIYPIWNQPLNDFTETGDLLKIPVYSSSAPNQYFNVQTAVRATLWERAWPSAGVLIYHIDTGGGIQRNRLRKRVDQELASGLYDWSAHLDSFPPSWGAPFAQTYAWENVGTRNTETGLDSFDIVWAHDESYLRSVFAREHYGSGGNYFRTGTTFSDTSSPSSRAYSGSSQSLATMIHVKVNLVDSANGRCNITAWNRHWQGTVFENAYWTDSVVVDSNLVIPNGVTLTILPGTKIALVNGATITVNGVLSANGTSTDRISFSAKNDTEYWKWLKVSGGQATLDYCDFQDFTHYAIYSDAPAGSATPVSINHCNIDGTHMISGGVALLLWNSPTLIQQVKNTTIQNVSNGATGMYLYNCKVSFDSVNVWNCSYVNSFIKKTTGSFAHCSFYGRTSYYAVLFSTAPTTPSFKCCSFVALGPNETAWPSTIFCGTGTSPSFGGQGLYQGVSNVFDDSCKYLMTMQGTTALPIIDRPDGAVGDGGRNDWTQHRADGQYIEWRNPPANPSTPYLCENQYWAVAPDTNDFTPALSNYWNFSPWEANPWTLCGGSEGGGGSSIGNDGLADRGAGELDDEPDLELLFAEACELENAGEYSEAQGQFRAVIYGTTNSTLRWSAAAHLVTTDAFLNSGDGWIPAFVESLVVVSGLDYDTRVFASRLIASYRLDQESYQAAIDTCVRLLNSGITFEDSIYVASDLLGIQMSAGIVEGGSLDAERSLIPEGLVAATVEQGMRIERGLFDLLSGIDGKGSQVHELPLQFTLQQNYPNPFNPSTEISFTLATETDMTLRVFDLLGREVAVLIEGKIAAGEHRAVFDGSRLTSGVYFYRLSAGGNVETRKMCC